MDSNLVSLHNEQCSLTIDLLGGAIVDFHLQEQGINPLNFRFLHQGERLEDFYFKGHFLCLGRWGDPSPGEFSAGLNKHGDFARLKWKAEKQDNNMRMSVSSTLEGLSIERLIEPDQHSSCFKVNEKVRNENALGRMYNIVQHPTIAAPFLNEETIVDCNATRGFDYAFDHYEDSIMGSWPELRTKNNHNIKLDRPDQPYSSVFSFIVNPTDEYGWITAWSPSHKFLLGYIWKRSDYPWINHWIHWEREEPGLPTASPANYPVEKLSYRGLEFGTTGVHKPFNELLEKNLLNLLGEPTFNFIDAGEEQQRSYYSFIHTIPVGFKGIQQVSIQPGSISIMEKEIAKEISIPHSFNLTYGF